MPLTSTFKAQITVTPKDKKWNEVMSLEKAFTDDLKKYVTRQKSNPATLFQAKAFNFRVSSNVVKPGEAKGLDEKDAFYISQQIRDYDVLLDLLNALRQWNKSRDEDVFGRRMSITVDIRGLGGELHLSGTKYVPQETKVALMKHPEKLQKMVDALNNDLDNLG